MPLRAERWLALAATAWLAACAGGPHALVPDTPVKLGRPYTVGGRVYAPADDTQYDRTGLASWYGNREQGHSTANGERFDRRRVSAAHPTLPMPSYVAVTRLDTGRTMLVRINDRGPYARDRILDLSEEAARQLGIDRAGTALVRVRRVTPTAQQRDALRRGYPVMLASAPPSAPPSRAYRPAPTNAVPMTPAPYEAPAPYATPAPVPPPPNAEYLPEPAGEPDTLAPPSSVRSQPPITPPTTAPRPVAAPSSSREILVATPSDPDAADALASALSAEHGRAVSAGTGYRVVTGPYPDEAARAAALARLRARGYQGAAALDAPITHPSEATGNTLP
jgi:rare lipoprotein A